MSQEIYELRIGLHNGRGNYAEMVHHYNVDNSGDAPEFDVAFALTNEWNSVCQANLIQCLGTDAILDFITARRVEPAGGLYASQIVAVAGGGGSSSASNGLSLCMRLITAGTGRRATGHMYIPAIPEGHVAEDLPDSGLRTAALTYAGSAQTLTSTTPAFTAELTVYHKDLHTSDDVTAATLALKPITLLNKRTLPFQ